MTQCNRCHIQYIGETKRRPKDRFNEHRPSVDKTNIKSKPTTVAKHFLSDPNHCRTDMQLIPVEIIHSSCDSIRKARESFSIDLARTLEPHGMIDVMNRKTCNVRKPLLSLLYFICLIWSSFPPLLLISKYVLRHSPLHNIVISFL